jgi:hypothetical protein
MRVVLPDLRVEEATPARQISASGVGNRARQSPVSASSRAARTAPERGSEVNVRVGVQGELLGDLGVQGLDLLHEAGQDGERGAGDVRLGGAVVAGGAAGASARRACSSAASQP